MPRNPHRAGASASQSFRADEVEVLDQLLAKVRRGAATPYDLAQLAQSEAAVRLASKVEAMKLSIARQNNAAKRSRS